MIEAPVGGEPIITGLLVALAGEQRLYDWTGRPHEHADTIANEPKGRLGRGLRVVEVGHERAAGHDQEHEQEYGNAVATEEPVHYGGVEDQQDQHDGHSGKGVRHAHET